MEMAFLVLLISNTTSAAVIPQPYLKSECEQVLKDWGKGGYCIAVPADNEYYNCQMFVTDPSSPGRGMIAKTHCEQSVGSLKGNKEK